MTAEQLNSADNATDEPMLRLILLGTCAVEMVSLSYIWGQVATVRDMALYYGNPRPNLCDAIGLLRAARRYARGNEA